MVIKIAICDDMQNFIDDLNQMLREYNWGENTGEIDSFTRPDQLISSISGGNQYDIVILDVQLESGLLGTSAGKEIKMKCPNTLLIYMSAYDYYIDIANAEAFAFIQKPIDKDIFLSRFTGAVNRVTILRSGYAYSVRINGIEEKIYLKNLVYFKSDHRVINAYLRNGDSVRFYKKLDDVEKEITQYYKYLLRPNKSHLVNYNYIISVSLQSAKLKFCNKFIDISLTDRYRENFSGKYGDLSC